MNSKFLNLIRVPPLLMAVCLCQSLAASESVLIKHGDVSITGEDVERFLIARVPEEHRGDAVTREGAIGMVLESIHSVRGLVARADQLDIDMAQLEWEAAFMRDQMIMEAVLKKLVEQSEAKADWDKLAREEYVANPAKYKTPERVTASHILITNESDEQAKETAEKVRDRLVKGEKFEDLAHEFSADPGSAKKGGDLGVFGRGQMVPEFEAAVFSLEKAGSLSQPVKTQFGYHIIRLNSKIPAGKQDFDKVKGEIIAALKVDLNKSVREREAQAVRDVPKSEVQADEEAIKRLESQLKSKYK